MDLLVERVKYLYDLQKNVVIVCGEGIVDEEGRELGADLEIHRSGGQRGIVRRRRGLAPENRSVL